MSSYDDVPQLVDTSAVPTVQEEESNLSTVPITIVTGYLGSGKSTMLKHLTTQNAGKKIAVILNEFGDTSDIERSLTVTQDEIEVEEWLELDNGCLCCTAKDAGVTAIENLMKRKGKFDYILLETTGVADPAPIASMFWLDSALASSLVLDGVVTMVDAANIIKSLDEGDTAKVQVSTADVIVINKVDQVDDTKLQTIKNRLLSINAAAKIIEASYGKVEPTSILDLQAYQTVNLETVKDTFSTEAKHDTDITTVAIDLQITSEVQVKHLETKLQQLLWEYEINGIPIEIHRTKGKINTDASTKIIQGVRETYEIVDIPKETGPSKLVLIGRGLNLASDAIKNYILA